MNNISAIVSSGNWDFTVFKGNPVDLDVSCQREPSSAK